MACKYPFQVENPKFGHKDEYRFMNVPCGKCVKCLERRSREWIFRLKQEMKHSHSAFFATFTYCDEALVWSESGVPTLHYKDFQDYMKRLRKEHKTTLKYYACGEYGGQFGRPHYHAILFNAEKEKIHKKWTAGSCKVDDCNENTIAYNTAYILKANEEYQDQFKDDKLFIRERALMSKGLGAQYATPAVKKWHKRNLDKPYMFDDKGYKYPIPRYYRKLLFTEKEERTLIKNATQYHDGLIEENPDYKKDVERAVHEDYLFHKRLDRKSKKLDKR